jgi:hypothetical protein
MRRIVIPLTATALPGPITGLIPISVVDVVSVEIVVVVYRHVAAAVPIAVAPRAAPRGAQRNSSAEREHSVTRRIGIGIRISRCAVNNGWTVLRNVDDFRVRRFDHNYLFAVDRLSFDFLLGGRFQISVALRFRAHPLDRIHHIGLLREEGITQIHRPRDVFT